MILRDRQRLFVGNCVRALKTRRNTLGIAPTGAGKTVCLSAIAGEIGGQAIILQHRDELVEQNAKTFRKINPTRRTSLYTADYKRWEPNGTTFAMIQTLAREKNLDTMPPTGLIVVDEAHHIVSDSYVRVIAKAKELNPDVMVLGVTATPSRGDTRTIRTMFDNVADQVTMAELIRDGHLVRPVCYVIESVSQGEMRNVRKTANEFDMAEVEALMNKRAINEQVVAKWKEKAGDRQTVVFASTVAHASDVCAEFVAAGVRAEVLTGETPSAQRENMLARFDRAEFQVIVNVMVLTEGWDSQPVSCVVLLRPCSYKSTMIQMIGRGLRTVDPERYPGVTKNDCIVLDFGYSLHTHKGLEQTVHLESQAGPKECPGCGADVPDAVFACPICDYQWPRPDAEEREQQDGEGSPAPGALEDFVLTEMEIFSKSPFRWESFFDGAVTVANGLDAWAAVIAYRGGHYAIGGATEIGMKMIANGADRMLALAAADDFLREYGDDQVAAKSARWIHMPPSDKQLQALGLNAMGAMGLSRYRASCMLQWRYMERPIQKRLERMAA